MKKTLCKLLAITVLFYTLSLDAQENDSIPINGFFDISAGYNSDTGNTDFRSGALDFYFAKNLSNKINVFIDLVFESDGDENVIDLERLYIGYDFHEYAQGTFGKFHTPYGYWNTAFHHGLQLQTSILRPKFLSFEDHGGVLSSHGVGIKLSGDIEDFSYSVYVTNGSDIHSNDGNLSNTSNGILSTSNGSDNDGAKLYGVNLAYYLNEDTKAGVHSYYQRVSIYGNRASDVFMYGAYIASEGDNLEYSAELYLFNNKNTSGAFEGESLHSEAFYAQVSYDFNGLKPYARVELTNYDQNDFYFHAQEKNAGDSYDRQALGINYSLAQDANIKLAFMRTNEHGSSTLQVKSYYDLLTQFAVRF